MKAEKFIANERKDNKMRDIFVVIAIFALIVGGSMWTYNFYEDTKNEFDEKLNGLVQTIDSETNKEKKIKEIEEYWKSKEDILIIFQEHDAIDDIEKSLYECFQYYRSNEKDHFEVSKANFIRGMEDLTKREKLTLVNIF